MEKINYSDWAKCIDENYSNVSRERVCVNGGKSFDVVVKSHLTLGERMAFINDVLAMCFNDGEYVYGIDDLAIKICYVQYYTNVDCNADIGAVDSLIYNSDIINIIMKIAEDDMYIMEDQCRAAIEDNKNVVGRIYAKLNSFVSELDTIMNFLSEHQNDANGIIGLMSNLNMNGGDVNELIR